MRKLCRLLNTGILAMLVLSATALAGCGGSDSVSVDPASAKSASSAGG